MSKAYDWNELVRKGVINDMLGDIPVVIIVKEDGKSLFAFRRHNANQGLIFHQDTLTDGKINYDDQGVEVKAFNVKDWYIISHLKKAGIIVGIITGRESNIVSKRSAELKLDFCHQGIVDKCAVFEKLADFQLQLQRFLHRAALLAAQHFFFLSRQPHLWLLPSAFGQSVAFAPESLMSFSNLPLPAKHLRNSTENGR